MAKTGVLFVDLGNICRSPMAEAVFNHIIKQRAIADKWFADSCGTGDFHLGKEPDARVIKVLKAHGIEIPSHKARLICDEDYTKFEWILAMDQFNMSQVEELASANSTAKIALLGSFLNEGGNVSFDDPYYDKTDEGFENIYNKCSKCIQNFLDKNAKK
ncbi:low molecular weight phosphotyrosine protein phosphatase-like protein [Dinothrombium tinctorium]|uniref:Low molecular weight phosphotyrosine protein phosphatase n=1 Tax=Dinothrombium tinctorium TaxID=1965070 RepID=A0A3S3P5K3_9ACAR|nr:low molecular weight phosphotyrosine protein phosphatase-like protein [Dinothrombium tinctorium]RWS01445.1 low molecular weight phosphotyrosine protein phosphatase-like protein [Dinothrombium tinctorium]RWS01593.1 low molecular weight phosphotyrosine protein phosphatase-like protein [Dinothrombium tinctorium]RWS01701.1 low molecular weight phosphotyrosine protein phosphatase-like protein [Dinothrombium tinctorium]